MSDPSAKKSSLAPVGALIGLAVGFLLPGVQLGPELLRRLAATRGESADWGEPLFFWVIAAVPLGGVGAVLGGLAAWAASRPAPGGQD